jgi:hypothetical protein
MQQELVFPDFSSKTARLLIYAHPHCCILKTPRLYSQRDPKNEESVIIGSESGWIRFAEF